MLGSVVKEAGGLLDRRFFLNSLLPVLVFLGASALAVAAGTSGTAAAADHWNRWSGPVKTLTVAGFAVVAMLAAAWLSSASTGLVRLYEGYWSGPLGRPPRGWGVRWHRRRLAALDPRDDADYARLHTSYPGREAELQPTRLGNILKNSELHPEARYGIDAVLVWPRLHPLLPADQRASLAAARAEMEFFLTVSVLAAAFSAGVGAFLAAAGADVPLFLLCHWGGAALALAAYACSLAPARIYGQQVKVTFDVHRGLLLKALGHPRPDEPDEPVLWRALARYWYRGVPLTATFHAAAAVPEQPPDEDPTLPRPRFALPLTAWAALAFLATGTLGALLLS
ncbi:hypothetical protein [Actinomadura chibensis]|uniref:Uncharacterized protein n=1 Tax=Actinomadura chibensis TaxID=392828 RepID=A0A5D0NN18_9ACTN|nr:hypothetical protein [Actinomadura chibensis]TYB45524.1 hypothetical protein FXF69_19020 [Actinomadura chibensis]